MSVRLIKTGRSIVLKIFCFVIQDYPTKGIKTTTTGNNFLEPASLSPGNPALLYSSLRLKHNKLTVNNFHILRISEMLLQVKTVGW